MASENHRGATYIMMCDTVCLYWPVHYDFKEKDWFKRKQEANRRHDLSNEINQQQAKAKQDRDSVRAALKNQAEGKLISFPSCSRTDACVRVCVCVSRASAGDFADFARGKLEADKHQFYINTDIVRVQRRMFASNGLEPRKTLDAVSPRSSAHVQLIYASGSGNRHD
eukprot:GHVU01029684.1.p1 GENE.GHVU01029684.1~~GHVU01029684.1.p1  ORF type:complete len:168 (+),score=11.25 GHVU01029684.1:172-675(+)